MVDGGDGIALSICIFDSRDNCQRADEMALVWARANVGEFLADYPQSTAGEVLVQAGR